MNTVNHLRKVKGTVVSHKPNKTIVVEVARLVKHPLYGKFIKKKSKIYAHDEKNQCSQGDYVVLFETKPVSKTKSWCLESIINKAPLDDTRITVEKIS
ncbi:MAG: 30S ribosomal protein S17 [Methylacidiphilales bacterium]|nr:30S ribosomal protein S17 [Candidatus Methylacidiphilales bacterium]